MGQQLLELLGEELDLIPHGRLELFTNSSKFTETLRDAVQLLIMVRESLELGVKGRAQRVRVG